MVDCFANSTYQLADLDGTLHASRVNGLRLKMYHARLMIVEKEVQKEEMACSESVAILDAMSLKGLYCCCCSS